MRWHRAALVVVFVVFCAINNLTLPIFEAPDEVAHYKFAAFLMRERRLPDLRTPEAPSHEAAQPPLYYALTALVISPIDHGNLTDISHLNPQWFDRELNPDFVTVANQHRHTDAERWPYQGAVWGVRVARALSSLLGAITILAVCSIACSATGGSALASMLAGIAVAFNPKFVHVASIVSNDIAIICAATVAMAWLCRLLRDTREPAWRDVAGLGALVGVAVLCKLGGLGLLAPAALTLIAKTPQRTVRTLAALAIGVTLTTGPWFVYNTLTYGDPLAFSAVREANRALLREQPLGYSQMLAAVLPLLRSYFGVIGVGFELPAWARLMVAGTILLAAAGMLAKLIDWLRARPWRDGRAQLATPLAALLMWQLALLALFTPWLRDYAATENGRLLMPGIGAVAIWLALGWLRVAPDPLRKPALTAIGAAWLVVVASTPFTTIQPAFALPELRDEAAFSSIAPSARSATFEGQIKLLNATLSQTRLAPREPLRVTLRWGAIAPVSQSYRVLIEAIDPDGRPIGRGMFIPFNGRFDTLAWPPGSFFSDDYALPMPAQPSATVARVQLSLFAAFPEPRLVVRDDAASPQVELGRIKIASNGATAPMGPDAPGLARFGDAIQLTSWTDNAERTTFVWDVLRAPAADYTLFVKAFDASGAELLAHDAQPFGAQYPTGLWEAGERVRDERAFAIPPGARMIQIGWYDASGARAPAFNAAGERWRDDIVVIAR
jgi:hypothetical protein